MGEIITQTDLDNLADIIWWIRGYMAGARDNYESCPFGTNHAESLRKARVNLNEANKKAAITPDLLELAKTVCDIIISSGQRRIVSAWLYENAKLLEAAIKKAEGAQ